MISISQGNHHARAGTHVRHIGWVLTGLVLLLTSAAPASGIERAAAGPVTTGVLQFAAAAAFTANETATVVEARDLVVHEEQSIYNNATGGTFTLDYDGQVTGDLHFSLAGVGTAAQGTLTMGAWPADGETVTIGTRTYTFQTVLTDVDGNVWRGTSLADAQANLVAAINLTGTPGTQYAASTTQHATVSMGNFAANQSVLTAKAVGAAGNSIATTETMADLGNFFDASTLGTTTAGSDSIEMALEGLSNLTDVSVSGAGIQSNPWIVTFLDPLPKDVSLLVADDTSLAGTTTIAEDVPGLMIIDPAGVAYISGSDELLIGDSEINEEPGHYDGFNLWQTTRSAEVNSTGLSPEPGSLGKKEPTGLAYNPSNGHVFMTNDLTQSGSSEKFVYEIDPGPDGDYGTGDDTVTWTSVTAFGVQDPEDVAYSWAGTPGNLSDDSLFIADGVFARIFRIDLGPGGVLDPTDPVTIIELEGADIHDGEGIEYRASSDTILVIESGPNDDIHEMTKDGQLLRTIDISGLQRPGITLKPADLAVAPASDGSPAMHVYLVDRGDDNNSTGPGGEMPPEDGILYELAVPFNNLAPVIDAGPDLVAGQADMPVVTASVYDDGQPTTAPPAITWSKVSGPGVITFGSPNSLTTNMSFSQDGVYVVKVEADDGDLVGEDTLQVTVTPLPPVNNPPSVAAGVDQEITLPAVAVLNGLAVDDGLPNPPNTLTTTWSKVSGPGTVTFGDASALNTTASFSQAGTYVLRLTGDDSDLTDTDDLTITVNPQNMPPTAGAGADQTITLPATASLAGSASDDGLPNPPGTLTTAWSKVSGPGTVAFLNASALSTTASFSAAGTYVLRLTADDGVLNTTDEMTVTVNPPPNTGPTAGAGADQTITLPAAASLAGTASDDGLPDPPGAVTTAWSKVSGPGTVTFTDTAALSTSASFSAAGTYVLRLTANDGSLTDTDDVTITVNSAVAFTDIEGSIFKDDIIWLAEQGITLGCNAQGTLFCPNNTVTRAQMASFLVRAYNLPPVAGNRFGDVSGTHMANINALAEAGITVGCNADGTLFCPNDPVTRAQMGSFLARAGKLAPIQGDVFIDVTGVHEPNINAIAAAGITVGCNTLGPLYCPSEYVTRGQMAAFLHRALG